MEPVRSFAPHFAIPVRIQGTDIYGQFVTEWF